MRSMSSSSGGGGRADVRPQRIFPEILKIGCQILEPGCEVVVMPVLVAVRRSITDRKRVHHLKIDPFHEKGRCRFTSICRSSMYFRNCSFAIGEISAAQWREGASSASTGAPHRYRCNPRRSSYSASTTQFNSEFAFALITFGFLDRPKFRTCRLSI